jgi:hypothetical protein
VTTLTRTPAPETPPGDVSAPDPVASPRDRTDPDVEGPDGHDPGGGPGRLRARWVPDPEGRQPLICVWEIVKASSS